VDCPVDCVDGWLIVRFVHLVSNLFDMNDAIIGIDGHNGRLQQTPFFEEHPILLAELAFVIIGVISLRISWGMAGW
jgi:hypothetical protein